MEVRSHHQNPSVLLFGTVSHWNLDLTNEVKLAGQRPQAASDLHLPTMGLHPSLHIGFLQGCWECSSGAPVVSTSPTELPLQPYRTLLTKQILSVGFVVTLQLEN